MHLNVKDFYYQQHSKLDYNYVVKRQKEFKERIKNNIL